MCNVCVRDTAGYDKMLVGEVLSKQASTQKLIVAAG